MFIILDNSEENKLSIVASLNKKIVQVDYDIVENNDFLLALKSFLSSQGMVVRDVLGLGLRMGRGRFTATRLLTTMANTLAFSLQIPVVRIEDGLATEAAFNKLSQIKAGEYILPQYSAEPHIFSKQA